MLNRYNEITLSDVRERTKMSLRIQNTTEHDDFLDVLIMEGHRQLCTNFNLVKKVCCLEIEDHKARIPKGFSQLIGLRFAGSEGVGFSSWYADKKFITTCECYDLDNVCSSSDTFVINGQYIFFNSGISAEKCLLAYFGLNYNNEGDLIIYEDYERGLTAYACWKFLMSYHTDYPLNLTIEYKKEWVSQKAYLKGFAQVEDFQRNKREIQNIFKSLTVSNLLNT